MPPDGAKRISIGPLPLPLRVFYFKDYIPTIILTFVRSSNIFLSKKKESETKLQNKRLVKSTHCTGTRYETGKHYAFHAFQVISHI